MQDSKNLTCAVTRNAVLSFCASTPVQKKIPPPPPSKFSHPLRYSPRNWLKEWRGVSSNYSAWVIGQTDGLLAPQRNFCRTVPSWRRSHLHLLTREKIADAIIDRVNLMQWETLHDPKRRLATIVLRIK